MSTPKAYVSALGMMGRRHVKGLVRAGFEVVASDPNAAAFDIARRELSEANLPAERLKAAEKPSGKYDVAIFAETTPTRLANFRQFMAAASAARILLEKPLSADPAEFDGFFAVACEHGVAASTQVNFIRRTWPQVQRLVELCRDEKRIAVTFCGGAIGLGCMGIHYLDTFRFMVGDEMPRVVWSAISEDIVASGRGEQFRDYGGDFVLEAKKGRMLASFESASSANVVMAVRGAHFLAVLDYTDMQWKLSRRSPGSALPTYRYGGDYQVVETTKMEIPAMDVVTEAWALGRQELSPLEQALDTHRLLDAVLRVGGAQPPYSFT